MSCKWSVRYYYGPSDQMGFDLWRKIIEQLCWLGKTSTVGLKVRLTMEIEAEPEEVIGAILFYLKVRLCYRISHARGDEVTCWCDVILRQPLIWWAKATVENGKCISQVGNPECMFY